MIYVFNSVLSIVSSSIIYKIYVFAQGNQLQVCCIHCNDAPIISPTIFMLIAINAKLAQCAKLQRYAKIQHFELSGKYVPSQHFSKHQQRMSAQYFLWAVYSGFFKIYLKLILTDILFLGALKISVIFLDETDDRFLKGKGKHFFSSLYINMRIKLHFKFSKIELSRDNKRDVLFA